MSVSLVVHDNANTTKRSSFIIRSRQPGTIPIPPTLLNSPFLSSPNSIFRRKSFVHRWPSQEEDEWLRDMVPIDRSLASDVDTKSEASSPSSTPSPTSSECPFGSILVSSSPMLRPRSIGPDVHTPTKRAGPDSGHR